MSLNLTRAGNYVLAIMQAGQPVGCASNGQVRSADM